jgi:RNA polymerase sigma-70 factor (ECF subfamily)
MSDRTSDASRDEERQVAVAPGDPPQSLAAFFDVAFREVYGYLSRRTGDDRAIVEDLVQDTFVTAVRTLRAGGVDHLTIGWLITCARSRLIDHHRRRSVAERHLRVVRSPEQVDGTEQVPNDMLVTELLGRLPSAQRLDVVLHHLDGCTVPEIATLTGRSIRAVESSLARGRRQLRAMYEAADHA